MRKLATLLSLALTLALPASSLAANTSGSTAETFTIASTISATFPASLAYVPNGGTFLLSDPISVSGVATNNPTGLTITIAASDFTSAGGNVPATARDIASGPTAVGGLTAVHPGPFTANTPSTIATASAPLTDGTLSTALTVNIDGAAPGVYTGSVEWVAATN